MIAWSSLPEHVRQAVLEWPLLDEEEQEAIALEVEDLTAPLMEALHEAIQGRAGSQNCRSTIQADLTVQE